ncbi:hypothetical protein LSTR_LSTR002016 [Laodelphax striatellus]|uniref:Uncharacterized protein n=1 Tax=Laodelphax striatellus TaxID=195883 RepID=A0A482XGB4_LAOST|nr:hypothetical protein LSTR_LSTR002016 [Laodelphax striatellus]
MWKAPREPNTAHVKRKLKLNWTLARSTHQASRAESHKGTRPNMPELSRSSVAMATPSGYLSCVVAVAAKNSRKRKNSGADCCNAANLHGISALHVDTCHGSKSAFALILRYARGQFSCNKSGDI